jgi:hypothetical protein
MKTLIFASIAAILLCAQPMSAQPWQMAKGPLMTRWAKEVTPQNALIEYPRPQMVRANWQNLNGLWDYAIADKNAPQPAFGGQILVPYPVESALSGVMKAFKPDQRLWYRRTFTVPAAWNRQRVLLHFGAVDWESKVFVNGQSIGSHRGGYDEFSFDITSRLKSGAPNEIVVAVTDPSDESWQLRGKQVLFPQGAAYTATSGIWQTVWLEPVPQSSIEKLKIVPDLKNGALKLTVNGRTPPRKTRVEIAVADGQKTVATASGVSGGELSPPVLENLAWYKSTSVKTVADLEIPLPNAHLWTSDDPFLYDLTVTLKDESGQVLDSVKSYFGMRDVAVGHDQNGNTRLMFNGKPIVLAGALDQGFWPDGIYTAPTDAALKFDVEAAKRLGLNAIRKHIKIEPARYYYWCDKLGLLVLQDMPAGYAGDPFTDAVTNPEGALQNESEMRTLIQQNWNHPSIIMWIMYNEGWGQHDTLETARWAKQLDPSRLIDEASGFSHHGGGDVYDIHGGIPPKMLGQIGIVTETMGNGLAVPGHAWPGATWAQGTYDPKTGGEGDTKNGLYPLDEASKNWFTRRTSSFYRALWATHEQTGNTGDFKVQLYDLEIETNGFMSYDRAVWKVDPEIVARAARGEGLNTKVKFLIPTSSEKQTVWRYTLDKPAANWVDAQFDDSKWKTGLSAFGGAVGGGKSGTDWTSNDIWLRQSFRLDGAPKTPMIRMVHDEDIEVYLNGVLAVREGGYTPTLDDYQIAPATLKTLKVGQNTIAVHVHQMVGGQGVDVGLVTSIPTKTP